MYTQAAINYSVDGTSEGGAVLKCSNRKLCAEGQNNTYLSAGDYSVFISGNILTIYLKNLHIFFLESIHFGRSRDIILLLSRCILSVKEFNFTRGLLSTDILSYFVCNFPAPV